MDGNSYTWLELKDPISKMEELVQTLELPTFYYQNANDGQVRYREASCWVPLLLRRQAIAEVEYEFCAPFIGNVEGFRTCCQNLVSDGWYPLNVDPEVEQRDLVLLFWVKPSGARLNEYSEMKAPLLLAVCAWLFAAGALGQVDCPNPHDSNGDGAVTINDLLTC